MGSQADKMDQAGSTIAGRYTVRKRIGDGTFGTVLQVTDERLDGRIMAIKVLKAGMATNESVTRFDLEVKALTRAGAEHVPGHEHIVAVTDYGQLPDGRPYYVMERLYGDTLRDLITNALPWRFVREIMMQVCAGMTAAHDHGIIHRDLKPENIFLIEGGGREHFVKLLDFGLVKLTSGSGSGQQVTAQNISIGTPWYMAPEIALGHRATLLADVYACGVILYEMLNGKPPFDGNAVEILQQAAFRDPPAMESARLIPNEVERLVRFAMRRDPGQRPQTMLALYAALEAIPAEAAEAMSPALVVPKKQPAAAPVTRATESVPVVIEDDPAPKVEAETTLVRPDPTPPATAAARARFERRMRDVTMEAGLAPVPLAEDRPNSAAHGVYQPRRGLPWNKILLVLGVVFFVAAGIGVVLILRWSAEAVPEAVEAAGRLTDPPSDNIPLPSGITPGELQPVISPPTPASPERPKATKRTKRGYRSDRKKGE